MKTFMQLPAQYMDAPQKRDRHVFARASLRLRQSLFLLGFLKDVSGK